MIRAVIFDMDGLMVDSEPLHYQIRNEVLRTLGHQMNMQVEAKILGRSLREVETIIKEEFNLNESIEWLMEENEKIFLERMKTELKLRALVSELVRMLAEKDIKMAVASSQQPEYVNWAVEYFGFKSYFSVVLTGADVRGRSKPDPTIFLKTAEKLRVEPSDCLVLEDSVNGVLAGKGAGMKVIAVYDSHFNKPEDYPMANRVVSSLKEVNWELISE